jgi:uncharacterized delta-60 repeat protein
MKKRQKPSMQAIPRIVKGIVPTTAIASGLLSQPLLGAPGDLDPSFGDMGRATLPLHGAAYRVHGLPAEESFIAGGEYCGYFCAGYYYEYYYDGFIGKASASGSLELEVAAALLSETEVLDFAFQTDGKVVAVGRKLGTSHSILTVFRLLPGGLLDPAFGDSGVMHYGTYTDAQSLVLDPSGAIVVAGSKAGALLVLRLLADGSLDPSFGNGGVYTGPPNEATRIHILRTGTGGYRVGATLSSLPHVGVPYCGVLALTSTGAVDMTFGEAGIGAIRPLQASGNSCQGMSVQTDGSLLLGGQEGGHGFVSRLLTSGALDTGFAAAAVQSNMAEATALAVDAAGSVLVAGLPNSGMTGALVLRLQASGLLDELFGNKGLTWVDLASSQATAPSLLDLSVTADGGVLAAGGEWLTTAGRQQQPLLVRLLGTSGAPGPGIIGLTPSNLSVKETDQTAVVTVRRMGGATGDVSITYQTADYQGTDAASATSGADYTPVNGRLTWADGDQTDQQITVPITADAGPVEEAERFTVTLSAPTGGAEVGTGNGVVEIAADGAPAGQFAFGEPEISVLESAGSVQIVVYRNYYSQGAVSVTVAPVAGSATSEDFSAAPITLTWADNDSDPKTATIPIVNDKLVESAESFTVELTSPTNGSVVGPHSQEVVTINDDEIASSPGGGGGSFDWFVLLGLGCIWRWRRALRSWQGNAWQRIADK